MRLTPIASALLLAVGSVHAAPSFNGQSGYLNMPDGRVGEDGTFTFGYSYDSPYSTLFTNLTLLPFLQVNGRFVGIRGTKGFQDEKRAASYGSYKDKVIDLKLRLLAEDGLLPEVSFGKNDIFGTQLFNGHYLAASKRFGPLDTTLGYGSGKVNGVFGGARWQLPYDDGAWSLLAEYDANDYQKHFRASETFARQREAGPVVGLSYQWGWLNATVARSKSHSSIQTSFSMPFGQKEYVAKFAEPAPYQIVRERPTAQAWREQAVHRQTLIAALHKQDFRAVGVGYQNGVMTLSLSNTRITDQGRAVGRAVRTAMYFAPLETRVIKVRFNRADMAVADYEFFNLPVLNEYLNGKASRQQLRDVMLVSYARPEMEPDSFDAVSAELAEGIDVGLVSNEDGHSFQFKGRDTQLNTFGIAPKMSVFFNDPSGAFRYEIYALATGTWRPAAGHFFDASLKQKLIEDLSKVENPSNSLLPHVRTDIAEYKRVNSLKLNQLTYTHVMQPAERTYAKVSAGVFEEMFSGVGGQLVYFAPGSRWIAELSSEAVQQRDYQGWFGRRDYKTVTGLASLHYKLPAGVTATARAGRFLAKDSGVRFEFKRRFNSGIEAGAWYTYTDGKDTTKPGTPSSPYRDKGIFLSIPLNTLLPSDSQSVGSFSIAPWTRDVGQRVSMPHDLVGWLEESERQLGVGDGLGDLGERRDIGVPDVLPDPVWWPSASGVRLRLANTVDALPDVSDAAIAGVLGAGTVALAATRDKKVQQQFAKHTASAGMKAWDKVGKWAPLAAVGAAGVGMTLADDPVLVNTSIISLQSAGLAAGLSMAIKKLVDRARPVDSAGKTWAKAGQKSASFPSNHSAVTMAALTPYAEEYQLPWLYVAGGLANAGRLAGNKHWLSDVVGGSLLGYGTGYWLWKGQRKLSVLPEVGEGGKSVAMTMNISY